MLLLLGARQGHILDWRGGSGRYAVWFAKAGLQVTLLDFLPRYIEQARALFQKNGLPVRLVEADSRQTPADIQADFAICLNNSVGFMSDEEEIKAFASLRGALRPRAKLLVDCMNLFFLMKPIAEGLTEWKGPEGLLRRSYGSFDFGRSVWHKTFEIAGPEGTLARKGFNQTIYTPHHLGWVLRSAGFVVDQIFGDFDAKPFTFDSRKIVLVASKQPTPSSVQPVEQ